MSGEPDDRVAEMISQLVSEASLQFSDFTGCIEEASLALAAGNRSESTRLVEEAAQRLESVKLLVADMADWAIDDQTGFIAEKIKPIETAIAAADAQFQHATAMLKLI